MEMEKSFEVSVGQLQLLVDGRRQLQPVPALAPRILPFTPRGRHSRRRCHRHASYNLLAGAMPPGFFERRRQAARCALGPACRRLHRLVHVAS